MNSFAEYILYFYLIVFISMLIFDTVCVFYRKLNDERIKKLETKITNWIKKEGKSISKEHCYLMTKKLKKISYFIAFTHVIDEMEDSKKEKYLTDIKEVFYKIYYHYSQSEVIRLTYFVYFLAKHPYIYETNDDEIIIEFLIKCTTSESVYLRENALKAIYATKEAKYIKKALYYMNYFNVPHNAKLLTDGLLTFKGDAKKLTASLVEELNTYKDNYKIATINYFKYKKVDCKENILEILKDEKENKDVRIACIRYFDSVTYDLALPTLYSLLTDDKKNWEYAAISSSTLKKYPSKETVKRLVTTIRSHNWYVRNNAASSLIAITDQKMLDVILNNLDDLYAKESLLYQLHLKGE